MLQIVRPTLYIDILLVNSKKSENQENFPSLLKMTHKSILSLHSSTVAIARLMNWLANL